MNTGSKCEPCRYWVRSKYQLEAGSRRRHSPVPVTMSENHMQFLRPETQATGWCGE